MKTLIQSLLLSCVLVGSLDAAEKKRTGPRRHRLTKAEIFKMRWYRAALTRERKRERLNRTKQAPLRGKVLSKAFADFNRRRKVEARKVVKGGKPNELWTPGFSMKRSN